MSLSPHPYILTGMVRSGSTLSSRLLDAHPRIHCSPDPFLGFFRFFRNDLLAHHGRPLDDPQKPLSDYFLCDEDELGLLLEADLDIPIESPWPEILAVLEGLAESNDPRVIPLLPAEAPATYRDLFDRLLDILGELAAAPGSAIGFKQTWIEAFTPAILNTYPEYRVLHLLRDPRAVLASWFRSTDLRHEYPFLMLVRHWRKSAFVARLLNARYGDRYHVYRYEDLVSTPSPALEAICAHLGLEIDPAMLEAGKLKAVDGTDWQANTSYGKDTGGKVSTEFIAKWRERLSADELDVIEILCAPAMQEWDYPCIGSADHRRLPAVWKAPQREVAAETEWIAPYAEENAFNDRNLDLENSVAGLLANKSRSPEEEALWKRFTLG